MMQISGSEAALEAKDCATLINRHTCSILSGWKKVHGNLGYSIKSYQPVSEMIASHLGPPFF
ncbi:MAG: hypothetical protein ACLVJX_09315 [Merdibacter sp.]